MGNECVWSLALFLKQMFLREIVFLASRTTVPFHEMDNDTYNKVVAQFITECRKRNGDNYPPKTLWQLVVNFQWHLRMKGTNLAFLRDVTFKPIADALDVGLSMKKASELGLGKTTKADTISGCRGTVVEGGHFRFRGSENPSQNFATYSYRLLICPQSIRI